MATKNRKGYSFIGDGEDPLELEQQVPSSTSKLQVDKNEQCQNVSRSNSRLLPRHETTCFMYILTLITALGGFLFGYDTGVISGAMILVEERFRLTPFWHELIVSVTVGMAIPGALLSGWLADKYGRKPVLVTSSVIFTAGALVLGLAGDKLALVVGRAVVGLGIGLASSTAPLYIAEASPTHRRGTLIVVNNLFITGGQCVASIIDGIFSRNKQNGWRYMLGLAGVPSVMMFIGFMFMPESPRWLIKKLKVAQARTVLSRIRGTPDIEDEIQDITETTKAEESEQGVLKRILSSPKTRKALVIGCGLQAIQQVSGINTVMYYSATIIKMTGSISNKMAIWLAAVVASGNFLFTLVGLYLVERAGRRKLILGSLTGVIFSLLLLACAFLTISKNSVLVTFKEENVGECMSFSNCDKCTATEDCGFCYVLSESGAVNNGSCVGIDKTEHSAISGRCSISNHSVLQQGPEFAMDYCPERYAWLVIVGLILYIASFAPGMGPVPWTINAEIYPLWARSTAIGYATATNWIFNLFVSMTFLHLTIWFSKAGAFFFYMVVSVLGWIFIFGLVPETKGKSLEHVQESEL